MHVERIGWPQVLKTKTLALIMDLEKKVEYIGEGKTEPDDQKQIADHGCLAVAGQNKCSGSKGNEDRSKESRCDKAAFKTERIIHGKPAENPGIHSNMDGDRRTHK